jgi:hypothetical protein
MQLESPGLIFPTTFCCNCGDTNCMAEIQDTRVTRYFGFGGVETTFQLPVPVCAACRKSTRRRPQGAFSRLLVWAVTTCVLFGALLALAASVTLPTWISEYLFWISVVLALVLVVVFYRWRSAKPPQTSFYQPVRIKVANVEFGDGYGHVAFMKIGFTNPEYLNVFATANRDAIRTKRLAVVKA